MQLNALGELKSKILVTDIMPALSTLNVIDDERQQCAKA